MTTEARRYRHWLKLWERLQDPVTTERFSRLFHKWGTEPANPADFPYDDRLRCNTCGVVLSGPVVGSPAALAAAAKPLRTERTDLPFHSTTACLAMPSRSQRRRSPHGAYRYRAPQG